MNNGHLKDIPFTSACLVMGELALDGCVDNSYQSCDFCHQYDLINNLLT